MENLTRYLQTNAKTSRQPFSLFGISAVHPQHAQHGGFFGDGMGSAPGSNQPSVAVGEADGIDDVLRMQPWLQE